MTRVVFNFEYILNGWFQENYFRLAYGRYVRKEGKFCDFSQIYRLSNEGDLDTYILERE